MIAPTGELPGGHSPGEETRGLGGVGPEEALVELVNSDSVPAEEGLERGEVEHGDDPRDWSRVLEEDRDLMIDGQGKHFG